MRRILSLTALTLAVALVASSTAFASAAAPDSRHTQVGFADTSNGYLAGFYYDAVGQTVGYVSRTSDGGANWAARPIASQAVWGLGVAGASAAWASTKYDLDVYSYTFRTGNGDTWSRPAGRLLPAQPGAPETRDVAALSADAAVVVGQRKGDPVNGNVAAIWRTTDGGSTWSMPYAGPLYPLNDSTGHTPQTQATFTSVDRAGSIVFALMTENEPDSAATFQQNHVLKSVDSGATWGAPVAIPVSSPGLQDISVASASTSWAAGGRQVYRTTDGSAWVKKTNAPFDVAGIDAFDANRALVVGEGGAVAMTVDGGASWTQWGFTAANFNNLQSVSFRGSDPNSAVAVGDDQLIVQLSFGMANGKPTATGVVKRSDKGSLAASTPTITQPTSLTLTVPSTSSYASARITCVLRASGAALGGRPVKLQSSTNNSSWSDVATLWTDANGAFSYTVKPTSKTYYRAVFAATTGYAGVTSGSKAVTPKVSLGTPVAPKTMKKSKYYTVYGSLKPRHTSGTKPVRIYKYRKVSGKWKSYGYVKATASNYSTYTRYKVKMRLTTKGSWRLRAYAPADSKHAATWSTKYDYVTVK